jgi:hypothetical protein
MRKSVEEFGNAFYRERVKVHPEMESSIHKWAGVLLNSRRNTSSPFSRL